ncbi:MAG: YraN family protein [Bacteroidales bacterium]|nr:YraN family protein [Bacteroidales bacterium]
MNKESTYIIGRKGEDIAAEYLESLGYRILTRNYVYCKKEIDIIARDGNTVVFVEVKERATEVFGMPYQAVTKAKQRKIIDVADNYLRRYNIDSEARFDIISITLMPDSQPQITHIKQAFEAF